jgi:hypothetical protein
MNKIQKLKLEIEKKQKELEELEEAEKLKDFKELIFKGKKFRIYKWENKPVGDFLKNIPKGFELAEYSDFVELFDNKLINYPKEYWEVYWVKHYSKRKQKEGYLSGCYLDGGSGLGSYYSVLSGSNGSGRVVLVRI